MQPEDIQQENTPDVFPVIEPERVPFWGYTDVMLMIGLLTASLALVMLATSGYVHFHPSLKYDMTPLALPVQFIVYVFVYLCFRIVFKFRYDRGVFQSLGWRKSGHSLLAAGVGGVLLAFAISAVASWINTPKVDTPFEALVNDPVSMTLLAITAVILAPLFEEMFFRGFLQPLLSRTMGTVLGIIVTAVLFGALHSSEYKDAWQYVMAITLVGVALGVLRAMTNSIIPSTVMHGCFNAVSVVGLFAQKYLIHK